ncbi:hypothetical protein I907_gp58 [Bacillus phage Eoghan]|uniref:Uncharacterized protein n=2 Tax=Andromedavirus TaxID=1623275 RepID=M1IES4_9CAUD|nr:hypothetical protein I907_gp58 [Bacillus phage Eoghan]YP_009592291.1 hypothetical protein FDG68_gp58 [Bacillus phage Taylor]AGE60822.1 hypothetical protein EOGHAN_59 [Bacillus phage Eoghan]AGE60976.1 hypothetical protein TAYLOR_58 [Bacillus phage Taylor]
MSKPIEARLQIIGTDVYGYTMFTNGSGKFMTSNIPAEKVDYSKGSIYFTGKLMEDGHIMAATFESWNDQVETIEGAN